MPPCDEADHSKIHEHVMDALKHEFLPEFLNRVDDVIVFHPLGRSEIREIVDLQLDQLAEQLRLNGYDLSVTAAARELRWDPKERGANLERYLELTRRAAEAGRILQLTPGNWKSLAQAHSATSAT